MNLHGRGLNGEDKSVRECFLGGCATAEKPLGGCGEQGVSEGRLSAPPRLVVSHSNAQWDDSGLSEEAG